MLGTNDYSADAKRGDRLMVGMSNRGYLQSKDAEIVKKIDEDDLAMKVFFIHVLSRPTPIIIFLT